MRRAYLQGSGDGDGSSYGIGGGLKVVAEWNVAFDNTDATTGASSSAVDDGLEATTAAVPRFDSDHQDSSSSGDGQTAAVVVAIDPTGLSIQEVLPQLQRAVAECLEAQAAEAQIDAGGSHRAAVVTVAPSSLSPDASLVALGMDSMRGIQLQALLEAMFTVQLPDELMFEPDATLRTLAMALVCLFPSISTCTQILSSVIIFFQFERYNYSYSMYPTLSSYNSFPSSLSPCLPPPSDIWRTREAATRDGRRVETRRRQQKARFRPAQGSSPSPGRATAPMVQRERGEGRRGLTLLSRRLRAQTSAIVPGPRDLFVRALAVLLRRVCVGAMSTGCAASCTPSLTAVACASPGGNRRGGSGVGGSVCCAMGPLAALRGTRLRLPEHMRLLQLPRHRGEEERHASGRRCEWQ